MYEQATIDELSAFCFGHAQNEMIGTGCSVIVAPKGACCGVDVSGSAPATRETDLLKPENTVDEVHALVLSGGSAFGLEASSGVMDILSERHIGYELFDTHIPIIPGASLFDLVVGKIGYPDKEMGRQATLAALERKPFLEGNYGAGCGACVGKLLGLDRAMKSGFAYSVIRYRSLVVGAFVVVNAVGNIRNPYGRGWLAGCRNEHDQIIDSVEAMTTFVETEHLKNTIPTNTTLGVIVCNARINKAQATKVSQNTNDAYARAIKPVHSSHDGDAIFTLASGEIDAPLDLISLMSNEAMETAIYRSAFQATPAYGLPAAHKLQNKLYE